VLQVTLQGQSHGALLNNLPKDPDETEFKQGYIFLRLQICPSAAEGQQRSCHGCFAGCFRLMSGRAPSEGVLQQACSPAAESKSCRAVFGTFTVAVLGWERTEHHASGARCCILPSPPSHHLGTSVKGQGAGSTGSFKIQTKSIHGVCSFPSY